MVLAKKIKETNGRSSQLAVWKRRHQISQVAALPVLIPKLHFSPERQTLSTEKWEGGPYSGARCKAQITVEWLEPTTVAQSGQQLDLPNRWREGSVVEGRFEWEQGAQVLQLRHRQL